MRGVGLFEFCEPFLPREELGTKATRVIEGHHGSKDQSVIKEQDHRRQANHETKRKAEDADRLRNYFRENVVTDSGYHALSTEYLEYRLKIHKAL